MKRISIKQSLFVAVGAFLVYLWINNLHPRGNQPVEAIGSCLLKGVLFGAVYFVIDYLLSKIPVRTHIININTDADEKILLETSATNYVEKGRIGGKICLTNKRIIFKSRKVDNNEILIGLDCITHVYSDKWLGIIYNGLYVETRENIKESFIMQNPAEWVKRITQAKNGLA